MGPLWQRSFFRQSLFHVCRYSLKDASIIITFYIFFVYEVSVWAGRERARERERQRHDIYMDIRRICWVLVFLPPGLRGGLIPVADTRLPDPQFPRILLCLLPSHCKRNEMADLHHQVQASHGFWGFKLRPSHLCRKCFICWDTSAQLGNLERLTHEQECMYTSHVKVPQPCLCWVISKLDSSSNWKLVSDLYLSNLV